MKTGGQRVGSILDINNLLMLLRSSVIQIFHSNSFCTIHLEGRSRRKLARGSPRLQRTGGRP
ncbi:hypothetical protein A2U01_0114333, partial [Trifolium medium]|nr:hypothetical protein [Trifolium medium]